MSSTPPGGYQPGDYVPYKDRDPENPSAIAGQTADPYAQYAGQHAGQYVGQQAAGAHDPYRAIYGYDTPGRVELSGWSRRVLAYVFDSFLAFVVGAPFFLGYWQAIQGLRTTTDMYGNTTLEPGSEVPSSAVALMVVGALMYVAFYVYNWCFRQGRTGYTFGKTVVGIKVVSERTRQPIGAGMSFVRQLAHVVDGLVCNLGYLWPIWDTKKQTFADKIMSTLVIVQPQDAPEDPGAAPPA